MDLCRQSDISVFLVSYWGLSQLFFQGASIFSFHGCSHHLQWFWSPRKWNLPVSIFSHLFTVIKIPSPVPSGIVYVCFCYLWFSSFPQMYAGRERSGEGELERGRKRGLASSEDVEDTESLYLPELSLILSVRLPWTASAFPPLMAIWNLQVNSMNIKESNGILYKQRKLGSG